MKLIVSHLEAIRTYVSRELYFIQRDLITNHGWRHIESHSLQYRPGSLEHKLRTTFGELPEIAIFWEAYELVYQHCREMQGLKCRKVFFADDLHWWNRRMRETKVIVFAVSDVILSPYVYRWASLFAGVSSGTGFGRNERRSVSSCAAAAAGVTPGASRAMNTEGR